jgi:hypothetical protein
MSHNLYVHFASEVPGVDPYAKRHELLADTRHMTRFAEEIGATPLEKFISYDPDELEDDEGAAAADWFDAHDVQHAAEAMASAAVDNPPSFVERHDRTSELIGELNNVAMLCRRAAEARVHVRLTVQEDPSDAAYD